MNDRKSIIYFTMQYTACSLLVFVSYYLTFRINYYYYPISIILILNVFLRLFSLGHDGTHGSLSKNKFMNDLLSRYFCYGPIMFSFNRYRSLHQKHHKYLGSKFDPDIVLDVNSPRKLTKYLVYFLKRIITLNTISFALNAYTDLFRLGRPQKRDLKDYKIDTVNIIVLWVLSILTLLQNDLLQEFITLWIIPLIILPAIIELYSLLHHRWKGKLFNLYSRNIITSVFVEELLFPTGIAYHGLHHDSPGIPWYLLKNQKHNPDKEHEFQGVLEAFSNLS